MKEKSFKNSTDMNTSELPQVTEAIIEEKADRFMNLVHENESMLKQLQANQVSMQMMLEELVDRRKENEAYRKEVDRLNNEALQKSLAIQAVREHVKKQKETITTLVNFNRTWLEEFEERFKVEKQADSDQIARDYIEQATWMASNFGRHNHSIAEVQAWIDGDNLPY